MSSEESYLAIIRYLTDEREPYAPGTHGNTKRKIRKAAACYVVRSGTLYYQRRLKGQKDFTELEVVLQDGRRTELINQAHIAEEGDHLNQQLTWDSISQKYWWRGILKHVKDHIRECPACQSRRNTDDGTGTRAGGRQGGRRRGVEEEEEEDREDELDFMGSRARMGKSSGKHELVFVDSKGEVNQFLPRHSQTMLDKLNTQRLNNQFCDITLLIEGEEHRAHKAVLAACSEYFHELFVEKGAVSTHEAVVDLSGFTKASFLPLLDFAYTSSLTFNFCVMADIATLARHLLMAEVLQICESVHKQVEEQQLMVYQRGDTHTVVSSQPAGPEATEEEGGSFLVTIQSDGQAVVTHAGVAVVAASDEEGVLVEQALAIVSQAEEDADPGARGNQVGADNETVTLMGRVPEEEEGETLTVVTHSGQAGAGDSLAVVSACLAMEPPPTDKPAAQDPAVGEETPGQQGASSQDPDPDTATSTEMSRGDVSSGTTSRDDAVSTTAAVVETASSLEVVPEEAVAEAEPPPPKRKRGRPAKVKKEVVVMEEEVEPMEETDSLASALPGEEEGSADDPNRRRLRQRSIVEGGYARLHMGLEEEEEDKKNLAPPPHPTPAKIPPGKPGRRGRPPKRPLEVSDPSKPDPGADGSEVTATEGEGEGGGDASARTKGGPDAEGMLDGEHACSECGMTFQRRYALIMHTLKHEKTRAYKCSLCSKEFQYAASLRAHLARHKQHSGQRALPLKPPAAAAAAAADLGADQGGDPDDKSGVRTKREFVCDICGKTLPKLYSLRIHMLNHTGVRPHCCKVCGKSFANKHSLKMHRALHDNTKQFQCGYCSKTFVSRRSMEEHTSMHTGESKYLCNICGDTFHRASALSKHTKKHQPKPEVRAFACTHCDKSFFEAKDLQQHMNKHMGLKPFQCQVCGKCYSWKKDWYSHVKSHSVAEPYRCTVCGKEFFEKALFRRHVKKATHGKKGRVKQNLERVCEHCGRKFTQLREYRRHVNNHQGVKPFECLTCGVAWADARSLKRHVRTHTGERPYVCPICQEAHIDARTLRKHMAKYHENNLPGKIMLEKDTLQFHNQGTQVEHAVSILASDLPPELRPAHAEAQAVSCSEEIETVLITEETVEAMQAAQAVVGDGGGGGVATLSDQSIMQVVNYVLAQQGMGVAGTNGKLEDSPQEDAITEESPQEESPQEESLQEESLQEESLQEESPQEEMLQADLPQEESPQEDIQTMEVEVPHVAEGE
ncbi:zinc finger and BTB domain-containing protein 11 [Gadus morhua]|uniref:zinc finger and BTB domain-containing protein 11 n=1 Tax=Gadus morhua TaxID=8049 RepID=UPI0011B823C2|nr:zinc finger and BTB domain-containing protein 11 [Gadus morhua]